MPTPQFTLITVPDKGITIYHLPPDVISVETIRFKYLADNRHSIALHQFSVTLAFAVTDYKSESKTYDSILVDFKRPL